MTQNQINELLLEALVTTEIDVNMGICQCKHTLIMLGINPDIAECIISFDALLISTCKSLGVYSRVNTFPIKGGSMKYRANTSNLWDIGTEYGQIRHRVYDQMILTLQDKLGITE